MGMGGQRHTPVALPQGTRPGTHFIGGRVGPSSCLEGCGKLHPPHPGIRSREHPACKRVAIQSTISLPRIKRVNVFNTTYTKYLYEEE